MPLFMDFGKLMICYDRTAIASLLIIPLMFVLAVTLPDLDTSTVIIVED